jgi:hypothetical protein
VVKYSALRFRTPLGPGSRWLDCQRAIDGEAAWRLYVNGIIHMSMMVSRGPQQIVVEDAGTYYRLWLA